MKITNEDFDKLLELERLRHIEELMGTYASPKIVKVHGKFFPHPTDSTLIYRVEATSTGQSLAGGTPNLFRISLILSEEKDSSLSDNNSIEIGFTHQVPESTEHLELMLLYMR